MADSDQSISNLRYNQITQGLEGFGGGTPQWTPLVLAADGGISQLTGDVTAGPGSGSQAATIAAGAVTNAKVSATAAIAYSKLAALTSAHILVGNGSNVATSVAVSGDVTLANTGAVSFVNASVTGQPITGYVSGAGTVAATDTILQAIQKLDGNDALKLPLAGGTLTGTLTQDKAPAYLTLDRTASLDSPINLDARLIASSVDVNVDAVCTINGPTNGTELQKITFALRQTGAGFAVTFASGAGNFAFGTDIPSFTASGAGLTDYVGAVWSPDANRWHVVSVVQGF